MGDDRRNLRTGREQQQQYNIDRERSRSMDIMDRTEIVRGMIDDKRHMRCRKRDGVS